jgi:hypothetical protein
MRCPLPRRRRGVSYLDSGGTAYLGYFLQGGRPPEPGAAHVSLTQARCPLPQRRQGTPPPPIPHPSPPPGSGVPPPAFQRPHRGPQYPDRPSAAGSGWGFRLASLCSHPHTKKVTWKGNSDTCTALSHISAGFDLLTL